VIDGIRLDRPVSICSDKAQTYRKEIRRQNFEYDLHFDSIKHSDKKYRNNRNESDHAALKRIIGPGKGFQTLRSAKVTLQGIEAIIMIKHGHISDPVPGVKSEITFVHKTFGLAA